MARDGGGDEPLSHRLVLNLSNDTGFGVSAAGLKALAPFNPTPLRRLPTYGSKEYGGVQLELTQSQYEVPLLILTAQGLKPVPVP